MFGFLYRNPRVAARTFLEEGICDPDEITSRSRDWNNMSIAKREKILKDHFCDNVSDESKAIAPAFHYDKHTFTFVYDDHLLDFGKMIVKNPEKEAKKEFSKLHAILRADIIQLVKSIQVRKKEVERLTVEEEYEKHVDSFGEDEVEMRRAISQTAERLVLDPHTVEEYFRAFQDAAKQQRMDDSNKGLGLNRSGNARFRDTWRVGTYSFTCTIEYWESEDTANASWFGGTDYKIGGASIPCYAIYIKIDPTPEYYRLKDIHSWIRQVRPFKGHFGPGNISQHWKTNQTGQEEEILKEIHPCLLYGFAGVRYEKDRTDAQLTAIAEKAEENLPRLKKQKHDEWVRSGGPEIEAEEKKHEQEEKFRRESNRLKKFYRH